MRVPLPASVTFLPCLLSMALVQGQEHRGSTPEGDRAKPLYDPGSEGWYHSKGERPRTFLQPDDRFKIYEGRPRLMIRDVDLPWLKNRMRGELKHTWEALYAKANGTYGIKQRVEKHAQCPKNWAWGPQYIAVAGLLTQETKFIDWCIEWAKQMATQPCYRVDRKTGRKVPGNDTYINTRTQCLAVVYDWFYDHFTMKDRTLVRDGLVEHVHWLFDHPMVQDVHHVGGHDRGCIQALGVALVALYPDFQNEKYLRYARKHIHGVYKATSYIARDGSYYMGWGTYTPGYTEIQKLLGWTTGTNDVLLGDWMGEKSWWYIYGRRGDNRFPAMEDVSFNTLMPIRTSHTLYAIRFDKNPYARWNYEEIGFGGNKDYVWLNRLLFWDQNVPKKPFSDLPFSRAFWGSGNVISRNSWDNKATHMVFRSVPFSGGNHRHQDQNSFILHYRGDLLLDSGKFGEVPGQYTLSSIAHNCMYFSPPPGKGLKPSDGEQRMYLPGRGWKRKYTDIMKGGIADVGGLFRYSTTDDIDYMAGEATKAYSSRIVKKSQREIVYIRKSDWHHPIVVVHDRNVVVHPGTEKRSLLHFANEPKLDGPSFTTSFRGGKLLGQVVTPVDPSIEKIGGPGKEYWKYDRNWAPKRQKPVDQKDHHPGAWRLEIYSKEQKKHDNMVTAFFVDDTESKAVMPTTERIQGEGVLGVSTAGWVVVFGIRENTPDRFSYFPGKSPGNHMHILAGLRPGEEYHIRVEGRARTLKAGDAGTIISRIDSKGGEPIRISLKR